MEIPLKTKCKTNHNMCKNTSAFSILFPPLFMLKAWLKGKLRSSMHFLPLQQINLDFFLYLPINMSYQLQLACLNISLQLIGIKCRYIWFNEIPSHWFNWPLLWCSFKGCTGRHLTPILSNHKAVNKPWNILCCPHHGIVQRSNTARQIQHTVVCVYVV